jgi:basic amino acid/polyamine antiporter, APA family
MWTCFAVAKPASIASITIGLARVVGVFPGFSWLEGFRAQLFAIVATWLITGLNYLGVKKAGDFQLFFTWVKVLLVLVITGFCFTSSRGSLANFHTTFPGSQGGFAGFMVALIASLWAYDGWNDLTMVAGEVKNPERSLPIALLAGVAVVGVLYMGTNAAIQYILPATAIAGSGRPAALAMSVVSGGWGAGLVSVVMALSILVGLNGTTMSGARVPFAAARDRLFPAQMAHIHPRFQSPSTSLVVQGLLSTVLLLLVGRFQQLFELAIFAEWLFYLLTATTIFVYRRRGAQAPFRSWGFPVTPAIFILAAAVLLFYSFASNVQNSLVGSLIIVAGLPVYFYMQRTQQRG